MTNKEIKLELIKAVLPIAHQMPSEALSESIKNLYEWILEEKEVDVDAQKTDYDKEPIREIIKHIVRNGGSSGYGVRIQNSFYSIKINTVGDLLRFGRADFARLRGMGSGSISKIDAALEELYGIKVW